MSQTKKMFTKTCLRHFDLDLLWTWAFVYITKFEFGCDSVSRCHQTRETETESSKEKFIRGYVDVNNIPYGFGGVATNMAYTRFETLYWILYIRCYACGIRVRYEISGMRYEMLYITYSNIRFERLSHCL